MTRHPFEVVADQLPSSAGRRLERLLRSAVPAVAPVAAISVWHSGEPRFEAYAGWLDPDEATIAVDPESLFDLASLTKLFTTTLFLRLALQADLDLDQPVVSVLPEFGDGGSRGVDGGQEPLSGRSLPTPEDRAGWRVDPATITFRQLLSHTSGLAPWRSVFRETGPAPPPPNEPDPVGIEERWAAGLAAISRYQFVARPGEECRYSDLGYMLLGMAASRAAGMPLHQATVRLCLDLHLRSVTFAPLRSGGPRARVVPTSADGDWRHRRCWGEVEDENAAGLGGVAGHAGLFATAGDAARFGAAWLRNDPRLGIGRASRSAVIDQSPGSATARGYGWLLQPADHLTPFSDTAYGHTGFTGTSLAVDPARDLVVALLSNRVYHGRMHEGIDQLRLDVNSILAETLEPQDPR